MSWKQTWTVSNRHNLNSVSAAELTFPLEQLQSKQTSGRRLWQWIQQAITCIYILWLSARKCRTQVSYQFLFSQTTTWLISTKTQIAQTFNLIEKTNMAHGFVFNTQLNEALQEFFSEKCIASHLVLLLSVFWTTASQLATFNTERELYWLWSAPSFSFTRNIAFTVGKSTRSS